MAFALALLEQLAARLGLGVVDLGHHLMQPHAVGLGERIEHAAVRVDGLQHIQRGAQAVGERQVVGGQGRGGGVQGRSGQKRLKAVGVAAGGRWARRC